MKNILNFILCLLCINVNAQVSVTFEVTNIPKENKQQVGLRGNLSPLSWDKSILLEKQGDIYTTELQFTTKGTELEYKIVLFDEDSKPTWENTPNRTLFLPSKKQSIKANAQWNQEQIIDISKLQKIAPDLLLKDYELIETMVLKVHPGTYRYNSEKDIAKALKELKAKFSQALTYQEVYLAVSKMMASIQCDHTRAGFNNQTKIINSIIHYQRDKIPFTFQWLQDEMIVNLNASSNKSLVRGTKILSINHVAVADIQKKMMPYIAADGATDANRIYKMQVNGYDFRYNAFDIFYALLYPITNNTLELKIQQPKSTKTQTIKVQSLSREKRFEILAARYENFPKTRDDMWKFEILSDNIAKLTLNSFGLSGWKAMTLDYKAFLADAFKQIQSKNINHLIIDIRENTGGNDEMAVELLGYLCEELIPFEREGRTRYLNFPELLKPYIKTWGNNPWFYELNPKIKTPINGYYIFKENFANTQNKSDKEIYKGKTYLLVSSANTSLAFYTAYRFRTQKIGTLIGSETGGNLNDVNGGQIIFLTLPNSQVEIDFPVMGGFSTSPQANSGVVPDIKIDYTFNDIISQKDLELERVLKLIKDK